ncbi:MAG: class I tRNA ligase family protein [Eggerthellaceae bacterium]|nr:class I tRNA ligase family protein [Eggerthellaceae bacterium]
MPKDSNSFERQSWPERAVVTAGMPYGNKPLHFGHIAGVFVPADCFARFLKDRIGAENVRFISGTDCFGSPIDEGYRKLVEAGEFEGTISEYVQRNHDAQKATLDAYDVEPSIYEGSGIGHAGEVQQLLTEQFITRLYENGFLHKRSTLQFFDEEAGVFLNGRQVVGRCPVQGCKSEKGYADECDLGHSYAPEELIAPRSSVTGSVPQMKPVENWYFDLPTFAEFLKQHVSKLEQDGDVRAIVPQTIGEFLGAPIIYVRNDEAEMFEAAADGLPPFVRRDPEKGKSSFEVEFGSIDDRDVARDILRRAGLRFRTGKTLVPFRITGNIEWGVKAPVLEGTEGLTVWCWPESLWAPISFTIAANDALGLPEDSWRDFWCDENAKVYQFIGQDNLYFYGVVQPALWEALLPGEIFSHEAADRPLRQTMLVANHHVLLGSKKASSSGAVKPPTADELLEHYTAEQLRAHFLALGLDQKSVGFKPKAFDPDPAVREDPRVADPALKESKLLQNVFNRLARSVLYEAKRNFECRIPVQAPTSDVVDCAHAVLAEYDKTMKKAELHTIMSIMDEFIRYANKVWADGISAAEAAGDAQMRSQVLADAAYLLWVCTLLMHPVVPRGCDDICSKLDFKADAFFSWEHDFNTLAELCDGEEQHRVAELEPRYDFFKQHPSQVK